MPFPEEELPMFCYASGSRLVRDKLKNLPMPKSFGFVVKNERGDSIYGRLSCSLYEFMLFFVLCCLHHFFHPSQSVMSIIFRATDYQEAERVRHAVIKSS